MFLSNGVGAEVRDDSLIFGQLTSVHFRRIDRRPNFRDKKVSGRKRDHEEIGAECLEDSEEKELLFYTKVNF